MTNFMMTSQDRVFLRKLAFALPSFRTAGYRVVLEVADENPSPFGQELRRKVLDGHLLHEAILHGLQEDTGLQQDYRETVQMIAAVSDGQGMIDGRMPEHCTAGIALGCLLLSLDRSDRIAVLQAITADLAATAGFRDRSYLLVLARTILEMRKAA